MYSWQKHPCWVNDLCIVYSCLWKGWEWMGVTGDAQLAETIRVGSMIYEYILVFGRDVRETK
jgi:hypothetical protein